MHQDSYYLLWSSMALEVGGSGVACGQDGGGGTARVGAAALEMLQGQVERSREL